jgi:hypothetical protein
MAGLRGALEAPTEHIYIASDENEPAAARARTVRERHSVANPLRRCRTDLTLYAEGGLKVVEQRGSKPGEAYLLDLQYLDPVPQTTQVVARRAVRTALVLAGGAALGFALASVRVAPEITAAAGFVAAGAALCAALAALRGSYERIVFVTRHGRAAVLTLRAGLGSIRRTRAVVPALAHAIEAAADRIGTDTSAFLRAEMREHYRLRADGVLSNDECADSTGRILAQFDVPLERL